MQSSNIQDLLKRRNTLFDAALEKRQVRIMRLKNIPITIDGYSHKDKNLFDLFLDHQDDGLFCDYVREQSIDRANQLLKAKFVVAFIADGKYSRLVGVYEILGKDSQRSSDKKKVFLSIKPYHEFDDLSGKVTVDWGGNATQNWIQWLTPDKNIMVLKVDDGIERPVTQFESYSTVILSYKELKTIIETEDVQWRNKLEAVNGIYCIADKSNGKLYIGSAYGNAGIWGRWKKYVETGGHGNNDELVEIISKNPDYAFDNFQWSILETMSLEKPDSEVIDREDLYKRKLCTRCGNGYNRN